MASIPVLSAVADLLTKTVASEDFKKLFQPWALVAAAIFLALNLLLVVPGLVSAGVAPLAALQRLPTIWQLLIGTLVLTALGYLINSLGSSFADLVNGNALRGSPIIHEWMVARQQRQFAKLQKSAVPEGKDARAQARALYVLAMEYPDEQEALAPTRFGNILRNPASYAQRKYGVHLDTVWPIMSLTLKNSDPDLFGKISDGATRFTFLATVTVLLAVVAVESVIVGLVRAEPGRHLLGAALLLVLAYVVHMATCKEAKAWALQIRAALDTHLDAVAEKLKLRSLPADSFAERNERWQDVSSWLAYGGSKLEGYNAPVAPKADWYFAPAASPGFEVKSPPTVAVDTKRFVHVGSWPDPNQPQTKRVYGKQVDYVHLITNVDRGASARKARGVYLILTDPQLARGQSISGSLSPGNHPLTADWLEVDPPALLWDLGNIPPRSTQVLTYTAVLWREIEIECSPINPPSCQIEVTSVELRSYSSSPDDITVALKADTDVRVKVQVTLHCEKHRLDDEVSQFSLTGKRIKWGWRSGNHQRAWCEVDLPQNTPTRFVFGRKVR